LGEDKARKLFDNTNTKIVMRMNDIQSAETMIEYGGTLERTTSQITFSSSLSNFIKDLIFLVIGRILLIKVVKALFL